MDPGKGDGRADAQSTLEPGPGSPRGELGLGCLLKGPPGALEITEPGLRRGEPARRARQELTPETLPELRPRLRERRCPHPRLPDRPRESPRAAARTDP